MKMKILCAKGEIFTNALFLLLVKIVGEGLFKNTHIYTPQISWQSEVDVFSHNNTGYKVLNNAIS